MLRQKILILERQRTTKCSVSNTDTPSNRDNLAMSKEGHEVLRRRDWKTLADGWFVLLL
jgi:hypothetical protein